MMISYLAAFLLGLIAAMVVIVTIDYFDFRRELKWILMQNEADEQKENEDDESDVN